MAPILFLPDCVQDKEQLEFYTSQYSGYQPTHTSHRSEKYHTPSAADTSQGQGCAIKLLQNIIKAHLFIPIYKITCSRVLFVNHLNRNRYNRNTTVKHILICQLVIDMIEMISNCDAPSIMVNEAVCSFWQCWKKTTAMVNTLPMYNPDIKFHR